MDSGPEQVSIKDLKRPLFNRPSVRVVIVGVVGLYLFILCAAYFQRDMATPTVSYAVLGPAVVEAQGTFPLRVVGYEHASRKAIPVRVVGASIETGTTTRSIDIEQTELLKPGLVKIGPAPKSRGPFSVKIVAENPKGETREITVPLTVYDAQIVEVPQPWETTGELIKGNAYHLELMSEGPGLAQGVLSRVWVRVTQLDGQPVAGVDVNWTAKGALPEKGSLRTNAAGLGYLLITPQNLMTQFTLNAGGEAGQTRMTQTLRPLGRSSMLWADRVVQAAGEAPIEVTVTRRNATDTLYCDLYRGDAWLDTWHLQPNPGGSPKTTISIDLPDADTFRLQCYSHYSAAGDGTDVMWLFRRNQQRAQALSELMRGAASKDKKRNSVYRRALPIKGSDSGVSMMAMFRSHHVLPSEPSLVASTRKSDIAEANQYNAGTRSFFFLMIGASFGLVLLWAIYIAIDSAIENRRTMAEAIEELGELAVEVPPPTMLVRARTGIMATFTVVVLILFIIALLKLFQFM